MLKGHRSLWKEVLVLSLLGLKQITLVLHHLASAKLSHSPLSQKGQNQAFVRGSLQESLILSLLAPDSTLLHGAQAVWLYIS